MLLRCRSTVRSLSEELGGDRPVGVAGGNQPQHLQLAAGQAVRAARPRVAASASTRARSGAAPRSAKTGRAAANSSSAPSASASARQARPIRARGRARSRRAPRPPARPRARGAGREAPPPAAPCASRTAPRACAAIASRHAASDRRRDLLELAAGPVRRPGVARRERDLDLRRQQPRAAERIGRSRRAPGLSRRPRRRRSPCASRSRARPGCGSKPTPAGAPVVRLGRGERAAQPMHLRLLVERRRRGLRIDARAKALAGPAGLLDRVPPGASAAGSRRGARGRSR